MRITGIEAILYAEVIGRPLHKYADPVEDERTNLTLTEAHEIAAVDPSLVWCDTHLDPGDRVEVVAENPQAFGTIIRLESDFAVVQLDSGRRTQCDLTALGRLPYYRDPTSCHV